MRVRLLHGGFSWSASTGALSGGPYLAALTLADVAGYEGVRALIQDEVIWVRQNAMIARVASRAGDILFFGPPRCGKSRIARATCGELGQEARVIGPSDLKGLYLGWGAHLIREQFDWLFEDEGRVLVIDEFDAVARSRATSEMHSDEKSDSNELLVQLDKAGRLGRLVLTTTNFIRSLDEAVIRSGRFGHFVPVGPPDAKAACDVASYDLSRLALDPDGKVNPHLSIEYSDMTELVEEAVTPHKGEGAFCCADLEEAVNRAFRKLARTAKASADTIDGRRALQVTITTDALKQSFAQTRRSLGIEMLRAFVEDVRRFCSREMVDEIEAQNGHYLQK